MTKAGGRVQAVLDGYSEFPNEKEPALPEHRPYEVQWVREFLLFAQNCRGFAFHQTRDLFLEPLEKTGGGRARHILQAADALRM